MTAGASRSFGSKARGSRWWWSHAMGPARTSRGRFRPTASMSIRAGRRMIAGLRFNGDNFGVAFDNRVLVASAAPGGDPREIAHGVDLKGLAWLPGDAGIAPACSSSSGRRAGGSIILTGSTTGSMGTPAFSVYSATKAAIRNFARSWALDLKGTGIRVNVLSPGATTTPGLLDGLAKTGMQEALLAGFASQAPLERVGNPDETAAVALFLASDDSSFMTGSEVFVDGGLAQV